MSMAREDGKHVACTNNRANVDPVTRGPPKELSWCINYIGLYHIAIINYDIS